MAQITLNIPDGAVDRVVVALCANAGVEATPANAKKELIAHLKNITVNYEAKAEQENQRVATEQIDVEYRANIATKQTEIEAITIT